VVSRTNPVINSSPLYKGQAAFAKSKRQTVADFEGAILEEIYN
jgi:hypothetical protein